MKEKLSHNSYNLSTQNMGRNRLLFRFLPILFITSVYLYVFEFFRQCFTYSALSQAASE